MKDIKYIIKRVIIGILIAVILSVLGKYMVLAEELGNVSAINIHSNYGIRLQVNVTQTPLDATSVGIESSQCTNCLTNVGKGYFIFSFAYYAEGIGSSSTYQPIIHGVSIKSGSQLYACEIGNLEPYSDSGVQWKQATAKCYGNIGSSGIERLRFSTPYVPTNTRLTITYSRYGTWVGAPTQTGNQDIVNAITQQQALQQQLITQQQATNSKLDTQIQQNTTIINQNNQQLQEQQETNDLINSDDTTAAESKADDFINSINTTDSTGLSGIITAPLRMITNLSNSCQPINLTIPYMNKPLTIPCMSTSVYPKFSGLTTTIAIVINGFLIYRVIASLYYMVKGFKDPENDKVEVMEL